MKTITLHLTESEAEWIRLRSKPYLNLGREHFNVGRELYYKVLAALAAPQMDEKQFLQMQIAQLERMIEGAAANSLMAEGHRNRIAMLKKELEQLNQNSNG